MDVRCQTWVSDNWTTRIVNVSLEDEDDDDEDDLRSIEVFTGKFNVVHVATEDPASDKTEIDTVEQDISANQQISQTSNCYNSTVTQKDPKQVKTEQIKGKWKSKRTKREGSHNYETTGSDIHNEKRIKTNNSSRIEINTKKTQKEKQKKKFNRNGRRGRFEIDKQPGRNKTGNGLKETLKHPQEVVTENIKGNWKSKRAKHEGIHNYKTKEYDSHNKKRTKRNNHSRIGNKTRIKEKAKEDKRPGRSKTGKGLKGQDKSKSIAHWKQYLRLRTVYFAIVLFTAHFGNGVNATIIAAAIRHESMNCGQSIFLDCFIPPESVDTLQWHGKNGLLLAYDNFTKNEAKYQTTFHQGYNISTYTLEIMEVSPLDLAMEYKCSSGFTTAKLFVPLSDEFRCIPDVTNVSGINIEDGYLTAIASISGIFPKPKCYTTVGETTLYTEKMVNVTERNMMYFMHVNILFQLQSTLSCPDYFCMYCSLGSAQFVVYNRSIEFYKDCSKEKGEEVLIAIVTAVVFIVISTIVGIMLYVRKHVSMRKKLQASNVGYDIIELEQI